MCFTDPSIQLASHSIKRNPAQIQACEPSATRVPIHAAVAATTGMGVIQPHPPTVKLKISFAPPPATLEFLAATKPFARQ
jgi:hypothetical protein